MTDKEHDLMHKLAHSLRWALDSVNHIDVSLPEYRDGVHATLRPNCSVCKMIQETKQVLEEYSALEP